MATVHAGRPTDLVALVAYDGRVYPNEAMTWDRVGAHTSSPHLLETALEQWFSFATGRHAWISVKGATLRGLASARRRGSKAAWEMDCLIDAAEDDPGVLLSLLDRVTRDAGRAGAEKVFLRVPAGSEVAETASRCGFFAYVSQSLLARRNAATASATVAEDQGATSGAGLRRWARADAYPAFRLYNRWAPERVRRVEAPTFREWRAARERISAARGTRQWVIERDDHIVGWLRTVAGDDLARFELQADPSEPQLLDQLIDAALTRLEKNPTLITLVPAYAAGLRDRLLARGFLQEGEFIVLAKRTAKPAKATQLAAATPVQTALA